jgi:signal transduction histidine kinase
MRIDDLRDVFLFAGLSDEQLLELIRIGDEIAFDEGMELFQEGEPADFWWVLLEGRIEAVRRAGSEEAVLRVMDRPGQWAGGFRAWDDTSSYLATACCASSGRMLRVPSEALGELARAWFPFGVHLIQGFFQTVRSMDALSRQRGALLALGTLAAGLAHEINNPASAATRAVDALQATSDALLSSLGRLTEQSVSSEKFASLDALRRHIDREPMNIDPLVVADREEALLDWLSNHGVEDAWRIAPTLAAAGVGIDWCERAAQVLQDSTLGPGLDWIANTLAEAALVAEVKESISRISSLVDAVKSYTQLDRAALQVTDVTEGIDSTLVMLAHKLGSDITVVRDYGADVPSIDAMPGELNQVWTNLIDNAIDGMEGRGTLRVSTRFEGDHVIVEICDTGGGMAPEVQARAFEPFYTTKDVSKGTGLGLDISRRIIVERHQGQITIDSEPGNTVLRVHLPLHHTQG